MVRYSDLRDHAAGGHANLATAFTLNGVTWASNIIAVGALAGLTTVLMVLVLGLARVLFAMSRDGLLLRGSWSPSSPPSPPRFSRCPSSGRW